MEQKYFQSGLVAIWRKSSAGHISSRGGLWSIVSPVWKKLSCAFAALCAVILIGGQVFVLLTALDWALLSEFDLSAHPLGLGAAIAALPSLAVAIWIARSAYRVEMDCYETGGPLTP